MPKSKKDTSSSPFPQIQPDMVGRLTQEADLRTLPPQEIDWDEIHRLAKEAHEKE